MDDKRVITMNYDDPKMVKKFERFIKKLEAKPTIKELKEIKKLEREALIRWKKKVKDRANRFCEHPECKKTKKLNAHHIESYSVNKGLRYDLLNGVCLCSTHHKFGRISAHKSFCFMYELLINEPGRIAYLRRNYQNKVEITKEFLQKKIKELS
jgi:hypothetical protein